MKIINRKNAEHFNWKEVCDGWHFIKTDELSVIAEKMPMQPKQNAICHRARSLWKAPMGTVAMKSSPI